MRSVYVCCVSNRCNISAAQGGLVSAKQNMEGPDSTMILELHIVLNATNVSKKKKKKKNHQETICSHTTYHLENFSSWMNVRLSNVSIYIHNGWLKRGSGI
jgi:hypothetical protein